MLVETKIDFGCKYKTTEIGVMQQESEHFDTMVYSFFSVTLEMPTSKFISEKLGLIFSHLSVPVCFGSKCSRTHKIHIYCTVYGILMTAIKTPSPN